MISHGVSRFLKERLFEKSDPYQVNICESCGNIATTPTECKICETDQISRCPKWVLKFLIYNATKHAN